MGEFWWQQVEFAIFGFEEQFWSRTAMSCGECKVSMISEDGEDEKTVKRKTAKILLFKKVRRKLHMDRIANLFLPGFELSTVSCIEEY